MRLSFGIKTSQMGLTYTDILPVWQDADHVPLFEHAWLWDHMVPLRGDVRGAALEAWTLLGALAAQTQRLRLGVMVTSNRLRNPALLAKMAATVDVISGGTAGLRDRRGRQPAARGAGRRWPRSCAASSRPTGCRSSRPARRSARWPRRAR